MNEHPRFDRQDSADTAPDTLWKSLTENANTAFRAGDLVRAGHLYGQARSEAVHRFWTDRAKATMADAPPMLIAASANAAECLMRAGDPDQAVRTMREALDCLCTAMLDSDEWPPFRQACFHHLKSALFDYVGQARVAGTPHDDLKQVLSRTRDAALAFLSHMQTKH